MTTNLKFKIRNSKFASPAALLWDESFLWGVMAYEALMANGLAFDLIRSEDVRNGKLMEYSLLFVPGGWASNKMKALGIEGKEAIKRFVHDGGAYLGFCGGAGLATQDGIGLIPVKRRPTTERVPSFSGRIGLKIKDHPLWEGLEDNSGTQAIGPGRDPVFHAWWPSQFVIQDSAVQILASYGEALPDSFSSDLNVGDINAGESWSRLEEIYRINLDPKRLHGEPAVIEGKFGQGKVLLSLVHFDTPDDKKGAMALRNIWKYLVPAGETLPCGKWPAACGNRNDKPAIPRLGIPRLLPVGAPLVLQLEKSVADLISLGERNFLWYWRNSMLLQWRRGVRGLEYCTLYIMMQSLADLLRTRDNESHDVDMMPQRIQDLVFKFVDKAKYLLVRERIAMQTSPITYDRCDDMEIQAIREELFSRSKSHGGLFKELVDELDVFLYNMLKKGRKPDDGKEDNKN